MQSSSPFFAKVAVKSGSKSKWYSESERHHHYESWRRSGLSMNAYSRQAGVSLTSLSKWARVIKPTSLPVPSVAGESKPRVEIILANGIRVQLTGLIAVGELMRLLQEVSSCN